MGEDCGTNLPPDCAALAELLFERLDAAAGNWRLEIEASDGRVRRWRREEQGGRDQLARFDQGGTDGN